VTSKRPAAVVRDAEVAAGDLPAEGRALQVEEAGGALQVGQRVGVDRHQPLELGPAGDWKRSISRKAT
jgi:hypothetical protein